MKKNLDTAIEVAAEYALHLHKEDGVPKEKAIAAGVSAVVRAARASRASAGGVQLRERKPQNAGVGFDSSAIMGVGSLLSAVGWIRKLVTGG